MPSTSPMARAEPKPRSNISAKAWTRKGFPSPKSRRMGGAKRYPSCGFSSPHFSCLYWYTSRQAPDADPRTENAGGIRLASVDLRGLTKRFGALAVVDNVSLRIDHGQLVCLLGPSGCGKTTTLRLIAGFLEPSDGEIHVGDRLVSSKARTLPPEQRKMSMIFQSYALWPHMTVTENIVYGLRLRKLDRDTIAKKLAAI